MNNIWFTSDTHYSHKNICYGVSEWAGKETSTRKFNSLEEMNNAIVNSINAYVEQSDELYMLGDWSFGGIESIWKFYDRLICKNIHLILGNHDDHIKKNKILPNCSYRDDSGTCAQDLFLSVDNYLEITLNKQPFVLCHYPMEDWYQMNDKGSIMLHGHNHHGLDNSLINSTYRRMDVGIDWEEFRPYSLEEILEKMNKRKIKNHIS